ncbi:PREDICTED: chymotrypsin-like elastase family member 2A [Papilio xuthus]|uniref:Chymotrypsin-like elastase family member 2A n=1 Tax=Papilio xuthus TaxID=66420 RepID=A0AAJ6ZB66_PAPXU|nr:PREDICTED: chymotrypsin-like elastase family member 2A [Papilio xuthus]
MKIVLFIFLFVKEIVCQGNWKFVGNPLIHAYPCKNDKEIIVSFEPGLPDGRNNVYSVLIDKDIPAFSEIDILTDSDAVLKLADKDKGRLSASGPDSFNIRITNMTNSISFAVKGPPSGGLPYFQSIKLNSVELCVNPRKGFLKKFVKSTVDDSIPIDLVGGGACGRRKILHTELIVEGEATKAGDWPWHVAIYRLYKREIKYICGGTLLSKNFVLTAAHCASVRGETVIPETLNVILGKHNLVGGDVAVQEKEVFSVILHENFKYQISLDNDIALLKLRTEVTFTDYVQPACVWSPESHERYPTKEIFGTVVGWGFDQSNELSTQLRQASMPIIREQKCYKSNPLFYSKVLNDNKFCAGWGNGTSACNGDSGGGFFVFTPDVRHDDAPNASGAWFLKGIVSLTVSKRNARICDPTQYVVFTDASKYKDWIDKYVQ